VASKEVEETMKGVPEKGEDLLNQFIKQRLSKEKKEEFLGSNTKDSCGENVFLNEEMSFQ